MKILAIDYGTKNIGLALSDDNQKIAFPYATLKVGTRHGAFFEITEDIKNVCQLEKVEKIIIGLPVNLSGEKTQTTETVFNFVKELEKNTNIPIEEVDERLSTVQAQKLQNKNAHNLDELSAQIFLQSYLEKK